LSVRSIVYSDLIHITAKTLALIWAAA